MVTRQRFVLDTTALTGVHAREEVGAGVKEICEGMSRIIDLVAQARIKLDISCHIPFPTVYNEIRDYINRYACGEGVLVKVDTWLVKKTPNRYEVKIPSEVLYEYVSNMRERMNKGMKVAEDFIWEAATESIVLSTKGESREKIEREIVGKTIRDFREKYRDALRFGILDSSPDIDVLLLAKEMDAGVVASDEGIRMWAERLGLRFVDASTFPHMLKEYLRHSEEVKVQ